MPDQPNDTRATAYVDDGETLHEGGPFTCFCCGNPNATRISDYGFAGCRNCQQAAPWESMRGEYRRRVANQFAKIFPSLREEPKVERPEEPAIVALLREQVADGERRSAQPQHMLKFEDARELIAWLDRHPSRSEEIPRPLHLRNGVADLMVDELAKQYTKAKCYGSIAQKWRAEALRLGSEVEHFDADPQPDALTYARGVLTNAWAQQDESEPPPAAPIPSVQGEGKAGEASERELELEDTLLQIATALQVQRGDELAHIRYIKGYIDRGEQERDRLRHSVNEQQGEIARLREELAKAQERNAELTQKLGRWLAMAADFRVPVNTGSDEVTAVRGLLETAKEEARHHGEHHQTENGLRAENARLQKELRDERERSGWILNAVSELNGRANVALGIGGGFVGDWVRRVVERFRSPTASAKEGEEKCSHCKGTGGDGGQSAEGHWEFVCDACKGTGKTPTVESGAELSRFERRVASAGHLDVTVLASSIEPAPQATAAEQPTPLMNEQQALRDARLHLERAQAVGNDGLDVVELNAAVCCVVAHLEERLTGERDAREGKANG